MKHVFLMNKTHARQYAKMQAMDVTNDSAPMISTSLKHISLYFKLRSSGL
jgi:hypothetical protein